MTDNLSRRIQKHKQKAVPGFTAKYNVIKLVYAELIEDLTTARAREHQLKSWRRDKKEQLINRLNPTWDELQIDHFL